MVSCTPPEHKEFAPRRLSSASDSISNILSRLNLCADSSLCDQEYFRFIDLSPNNKPYDYFLFQERAGNSGNHIEVFAKADTGYKSIQSFFAFFDSCSRSVSQGMYDLYITEKIYPRGHAQLKYSWKNGKYILYDVLSVNKMPLQLLTCIGYCEKDFSQETPYIKDKPETDPYDYEQLKIDTLKQDKRSVLMTVGIHSSDWHKQWIVKYSQGKYNLMKEQLSRGVTY